LNQVRTKVLVAAGTCGVAIATAAAVCEVAAHSLEFPKLLEVMIAVGMFIGDIVWSMSFTTGTAAKS
jgi:flagellar biosynthesis protein FliQ